MPALTPHHRLCQGILAEGGRFVTALDEVELDRPVPTCPGWTAGQLMGHLRQAHDWASVIVETRATSRVSLLETSGGDAADLDGHWTEQIARLALRSLEAFGDPVDRQRLATWLRAGVHRLTTALTEAGPDTPVWREFCPPRAHTWARWALLETSVHRADAEIVAERPFTLERDLCLDSIDLWLTYVREPAAAPFLNPRLANMKAEGERLRFRPTDASPEHPGWMAVCTPVGVATARWSPDTDGTAEPDVTVSGTACELLLLLKRRVALDTANVEIRGRRALIEKWLANVLC